MSKLCLIHFINFHLLFVKESYWNEWFVWISQALIDPFASTELLIASSFDQQMSSVRLDIRKLLRYEYRPGHSARAATDNICLVEGLDAVSYVTARRWFSRFRQGNLEVEDEPHSRRHQWWAAFSHWIGPTFNNSRFVSEVWLFKCHNLKTSGRAWI